MRVAPNIGHPNHALSPAANAANAGEGTSENGVSGMNFAAPATKGSKQKVSHKPSLT